MVVVEAEESSFVKELAEPRVRVEKMGISKREESVPPTSIIVLPQNDAPPSAEAVNYVQNGVVPIGHIITITVLVKGVVILIVLMVIVIVLIQTSHILTAISLNPLQDLM